MLVVSRRMYMCMHSPAMKAENLKKLQFDIAFSIKT